MRFLVGRTPKHAVSRRKAPRKGLPVLAAVVAVGAGLVMGPVAGALTASPAAAAPVISAVGAMAKSFGSAQTTLNVNPQQLGDVLVVMAENDLNTVTVSSMSGGGVTTWKRAIQYVGSAEPRAYEIWYGVVTATGSSTITFNLSADISGHNAEYEAQEFTAGFGAGTMWTLDTTGVQENPSSTTTVTYPSLTPAGGGELYFGFADMPMPPSNGSTPGFTYTTTLDANQVAYNPASGAGTVQPTSSQSPASVISAVAAFFSVSPPTPAPTVTGVGPTGGPITGGTRVTVSGTNLTGATAVAFGSGAGSSITVNGAGSLTVTAPAQAVGTVHVSVTTPSGSSPTGPADRFTSFAAPTVTAVSPNTGPSSGGTSVTVTGTNLGGASTVTFGSGAGTNIAVNGGGSSLTVTAPAGAVGKTDVTVTTPGGTSAIGGADKFTYLSVGYWMVGADGSIFSFGGAPFEGSLPGLNIHVTNVVGLVPTADSKGYWMIGSDGGVFAFGDAGFVGSLPGLGIHVTNIRAVVPTSTGKGYWMIGSDGGVFAFGDAGFVGSIPGLNIHINNIVAVVPTSTGKGYWMIGNDGGVFAFGDAGFVGSIPGLGIHINNIVGAVTTSNGKGYWMVGKDGGVFAFGNAGFVGSLPGIGIHVTNVVGVVATHDNGGYWMIGSDGGVFAFGNAGFVGA